MCEEGRRRRRRRRGGGGGRPSTGCLCHAGTPPSSQAIIIAENRHSPEVKQRDLAQLADELPENDALHRPGRRRTDTARVGVCSCE